MPILMNKTCNVSGSKCDDQLFGFCAFSPRFWHKMFVEKFNCAFEARKFHPKMFKYHSFLYALHCIGNLTHPKGRESFVETVQPFGLIDEWSTLTQSGRCGRRCLNSYFHCFHRGKHHISEEFGTSTWGQVKTCAISVGHFLEFIILSIFFFDKNKTSPIKLAYTFLNNS